MGCVFIFVYVMYHVHPCLSPVKVASNVNVTSIVLQMVAIFGILPFGNEEKAVGHLMNLKLLLRCAVGS